MSSFTTNMLMPCKPTFLFYCCIQVCLLCLPGLTCNMTGMPLCFSNFQLCCSGNPGRSNLVWLVWLFSSNLWPCSSYSHLVTMITLNLIFLVPSLPSLLPLPAGCWEPHCCCCQGWAVLRAEAAQEGAGQRAARRRAPRSQECKGRTSTKDGLSHRYNDGFGEHELLLC